MANVGRSVICVGSGNNGNDRIHTAGRLQQGQSEIVEMSVGAYETTLNLQLWKAYADEIEIFLETPSGEKFTGSVGENRYSEISGRRDGAAGLLWKTGTFSGDTGDLR